jgi:pimeloyl-ACP methyl ester carboxylesterase
MPDELADLSAATAGVKMVPGTGHFPFLETPGLFRTIALRIFGNGKPRRKPADWEKRGDRR